MTSVPPDVEAFSEQFADFPTYCCVEFLQGFDQIGLSFKSRDMIAIRIPDQGLFVLTRLPQGHINSAAVFTRVVENAN